MNESRLCCHFSVLSKCLPLLSFPRTRLTLQEASVRGNMALSLEKFMNEIDGDNFEDSDEYSTLCEKLDHVTCKLIYNKICDNELDAALGLAYRLHSDKAFGIAVKMADLKRKNKLAQEIEREQQRRFAPTEGEVLDDNSQEDDYGMTSDRYDRASSSSQISPESSHHKLKRSSMMEEEEGAHRVPMKKTRFE